MATLQVKNMPDDLHAALRARADMEGTTLSELVTRVLRKELSLPSMTEWLDEVAALEPVRVTTGTTEVMREIRGEMPDARS
ncbi:MAG TPA: hypothetical protein VFV76_00580 [Actinomycetes bacterium]|nr:hypothetical protein [Actinomycetes bacterium]